MFSAKSRDFSRSKRVLGNFRLEFFPTFEMSSCFRHFNVPACGKRRMRGSGIHDNRVRWSPARVMWKSLMSFRDNAEVIITRSKLPHSNGKSYDACTTNCKDFLTLLFSTQDKIGLLIYHDFFSLLMNILTLRQEFFFNCETKLFINRAFV